MGFSDLFPHKYRFAKVPPENAYLCPACYEAEETEEHLLLAYPVYEDLRQMYIRALKTNVFDVKALLSLEEP